MSPRPSLQKRMFSIIGPALGVIVVYNFIFYAPLQRVLKAERVKLRKLEVSSSRRPTAQTLAEKLAKVEGEVKSLNQQITESKSVGSHLVSRRADLRTEFLQSNSPATVMAETLSLLSQHGLQCVNTSPSPAQDHSAAISESLKPVALLLGETNSPTVDSIDRREMRITLRGRFQDIQSALREIQAAPLGIFTVSLEMEDSDAHSDIHTWILTIAV